MFGKKDVRDCRIADKSVSTYNGTKFRGSSNLKAQGTFFSCLKIILKIGVFLRKNQLYVIYNMRKWKVKTYV